MSDVASHEQVASPVKVAVVGLGWWSMPVGNAVRASAALDLAACYTRNPEKREAYARAHDCAAAASFEAVLADGAIEGVLLTTPNTAHAGQIEAALAAGKHVWVEKPVTNTLAEVPAVLAAWRASGRVLAVGHCYRRAAGHREMRALIDDGTLGTPLWAKAAFTGPGGQKFTPAVWRYFRDQSPGGPLMQMGIHHCDTLRYLLGEVVRITGVHRRLATPAEIDDLTMTIYEHESGVVSQVTSCFTSPATFTMELHGTEAALRLEMVRDDIALAERTDAETTLHIESKDAHGWSRVPLPEGTPMIQSELEEFAACVRGGGAPETGPREAVHALAMVEGSVRSAEAGRAVEMATLLEGIDV